MKRSPRIVISEIVQDLLNGNDFAGNVRLLAPVRREAISYLLTVLDGAVHHHLAPGVDQRDAHDAALGAVVELGKRDIDFLVDLLESELPFNRMQPAFSLAWVLAHLDTPKRVEPLMKAVKHPNPYVRWAACGGLGRAGSKRARPLLNAAAADRSSLVRGTAVHALRTIGNETSLPVLEKRLRDRYPGIRAAAGKAIAAIKGRRRRR